MNEGKITLDSFRTRRTNMVSDSTIERLFMKIKTGDYLSRLLSTYYLSNRIKEYSEVSKAEEVLENAIEDYKELPLWKVLSIVNDTLDEGSRFCVLNAIFIVPSEVPAMWIVI